MSIIDPIDLEIIWQRLIAIAEEQARTLVRSSFSAMTAEMEDIASALFDAQGNMIAEGITGTIGIITALVQGVPCFLKEYPPNELSQGDLLISNDPWILAGHNPDMAIVRPVFSEDTLIGFTATVSHVPDIGGRGGWGSDATEIYEEGLILPVMKLFNKGKVNIDLRRLIETNVRVPEQTMGDIFAQVSATSVGAKNLEQLIREYKLGNLESVSKAILTRSEEAVRDAIEKVPNGAYHDEVFAEGLDEPIRIAVKLLVEGDYIVVDLAGSSSQVPAAINCTYNYTLAHITGPLKSALCPEIPNNTGTYSPIRLEAPKGSIVNAIRPAPLMDRHLLSQFINSVISGALAQAIPDRVLADAGEGGSASFQGLDLKGKRFSSSLGFTGGMPARPIRDGLHTTHYPSNLSSISVEILESRTPILVLGKELITDSGGAGRYRGGCGQQVTITIRGENPVSAGFVLERTKFPSRGRLGGHSGRCARIIINKSIRPHGKERIILRPGDQVIMEYPGGGGFFPPEERDLNMVLDDVRNGIVSLAKAREEYRVSIDKSKMSVNLQESKQLRGETHA